MEVVDEYHYTFAKTSFAYTYILPATDCSMHPNGTQEPSGTKVVCQHAATDHSVSLICRQA